MIFNIEIYLMLFIIYSFLGWVMECTLNVIEKHKFVNRGFLIGPYCPIYGVGVVSVSLLLSKITNNIFLLFILATLICGSLEYFTSYIMEKIFKARWWDYNRRKFNINGRICLETLIPFGLISVFVICCSNPWIIDKLYMIPKSVLDIILIIFFIIFITDSFISFNVILKFKNLSKQEKDNTEEITRKVKETTETAIKKLSMERDALIKKINISRLSVTSNIKYNSKKYTNKIKNQQLTLVGTFKARIQGIDDRMKNLAKDLTDKISNLRQIKLNKDIKEKFVNQSKLNKRLISAFPNVEQREYTRKKKK